MRRCLKCHFPLEGKLSRFIGRIAGIKPSATHSGLCTRCAPDKKRGTYTCQICDRQIDVNAALTHVKTEEYLLNLIKKDHPEWREEKGTCPQCVAYYRELIKKADI